MQKIHENERSWTERGRRVPGDPFGSATADCSLLKMSTKYLISTLDLELDQIY